MTIDRARLDQMPTDAMLALLETLEIAVEAVKDALVCRLDDLDDEAKALRSELEDRGYTG